MLQEERRTINIPTSLLTFMMAARGRRLKVEKFSTPICPLYCARSHVISALYTLRLLKIHSQKGNPLGVCCTSQELGSGLRSKMLQGLEYQCRSFLVWTEGIYNATSVQDSSSFMIKPQCILIWKLYNILLQTSVLRCPRRRRKYRRSGCVSISGTTTVPKLVS